MKMASAVRTGGKGSMRRYCKLHIFILKVKSIFHYALNVLFSFLWFFKMLSQCVLILTSSTLLIQLK